MRCKAAALMLLLASCASNTGTGMFAGAILGAGAGGIGGGGNGALIGSAAGLIAGGLIGAALDSQERRKMEYTSPQTVDRMDRGEPLTLNDIIQLSQNKVSDDTICRYIQETSSFYPLTQPELRRLKDSGVSQRIIQQFIDSGR